MILDGRRQIHFGKLNAPKNKLDVPDTGWSYAKILQFKGQNGKLSIAVDNLQDAAKTGRNPDVAFKQISDILELSMGYSRGLTPEEQDAVWSAAVIAEAAKVKDSLS